MDFTRIRSYMALQEAEMAGTKRPTPDENFDFIDLTLARIRAFRGKTCPVTKRRLPKFVGELYMDATRLFSFVVGKKEGPDQFVEWELADELSPEMKEFCMNVLEMYPAPKAMREVPN